MQRKWSRIKKLRRKGSRTVILRQDWKSVTFFITLEHFRNTNNYINVETEEVKKQGLGSSLSPLHGIYQQFQMISLQTSSFPLKRFGAKHFLNFAKTYSLNHRCSLKKKSLCLIYYKTVPKTNMPEEIVKPHHLKIRTNLPLKLG